MRKILILISCLLVIFCFTACGTKDDSSSVNEEGSNIDTEVYQSTKGMTSFVLGDVLDVFIPEGYVADDSYSPKNVNGAIPSIVFYDKENTKSISVSLLGKDDYSVEYEDFAKLEGTKDTRGEYKKIVLDIGDFYFCQSDDYYIRGFIKLDDGYVEITHYAMDDNSLGPQDMVVFEKFLKSLKKV